MNIIGFKKQFSYTIDSDLAIYKSSKRDLGKEYINMII